MIGFFQTWSDLSIYNGLRSQLFFLKAYWRYNGDLLPFSRFLSKRGLLELPLVVGHFLFTE